MQYDFDRAVDRRHSYSQKWDATARYFGRDDILPLWVADMDFACPPPVLSALAARLKRGVMGYTFIAAEHVEAVTAWVARRHAWSVEADWVLFSPNVVFSINLAVAAYTEPGDGIVVQPPVYPPLFSAPARSRRKVIYNRLCLGRDGYGMDFQDLRDKLDAKTRMLILCSPHNPAGRVWNEAELTELSQICVEHDLILLSDEIHCDLVYPGARHIPVAALSPEIARRTVTLNSPSKTFNIPGLPSSNVIISDEGLRRRFEAQRKEWAAPSPGIFGLAATMAAYTRCESWLDDLLDYLKANRDFVSRYIEDRIPALRVVEPEGTFLMWIDCRGLKMPEADLQKLLVQQARLGLSPGSWYGPGGEGFQRLNIGCPRSTLQQALERLERAIDSRPAAPQG